MSFDVVVVGAGPAGMIAAGGLADRGFSVGVVDDNPGIGGQIGRGDAKITGFDPNKLCTILRTAVVQVLADGSLLAVDADGPTTLRWKKLVLATGAQEILLPFEGWTLPGVLGAGGLQALIKSGLDVAGKRVVIAGSGPLLIAVAALARAKGALVPLVAEQAGLGQMLPFVLSIARSKMKRAQAMEYLKALRGTRRLNSVWVTSVAEGPDGLSVRLSNGRSVECDYLGVGYGLAPRTELARILGCELDDGFVKVDPQTQETSVPGVYAAGEVTGIGGIEKATIEGAQIAISLFDGEPPRLGVEEQRRFAATLRTSFALRNELKHLARPETIVCRCEDVTFAALAKCETRREAKLQTRCGMGPCQGRVCGAALGVLFGWPEDTVRPPLFPVPASVLADE